jgi:SAM-dependent methyltransferase
MRVDADIAGLMVWCIIEDMYQRRIALARVDHSDLARRENWQGISLKWPTMWLEPGLYTPSKNCHGADMSPSPDFQLWDTAWLPDRIQKFTRGTPRNIHAFRHRCYFEDLWPLIERSGGRGRYLEIGAGRGTTSMYLASRGCDVTLLDYSPTGLEVARRNFAREGLPAPHTIVADARRTGLPEAAYDCVYSIGLFEHIDNPRPVLDEILRVLKPSGYLFTVVIPQLPASVAYLAYGLFAPWRLMPLLLPRPVKSLGK